MLVAVLTCDEQSSLLPPGLIPDAGGSVISACSSASRTTFAPAIPFTAGLPWSVVQDLWPQSATHIVGDGRLSTVPSSESACSNGRASFAPAESLRAEAPAWTSALRH